MANQWVEGSRNFLKNSMALSEDRRQRVKEDLVNKIAQQELDMKVQELPIARMKAQAELGKLASEQEDRALAREIANGWRNGEPAQDAPKLGRTYDFSDPVTISNPADSTGEGVSVLGYRKPVLGRSQMATAPAPAPSPVLGKGPMLKSIKLGGMEFTNPNYVDPYKEAILEEKKMKMQDKKDQQALAAENIHTEAQNMLDTIQEVKKGKDYFGPLGDMPSIPFVTGNYGKRVEWESNVNNLLSKKVIDIMNEMKRASRTGATGFGQLNQSELQLLKNSSTVLNKRLPPDIAMKYLNQMEGIYQKVLNGGGNAPGAVQQAGGQSVIPAWAKGDANRYQKAVEMGYPENEIKDWFLRNGRSSS